MAVYDVRRLFPAAQPPAGAVVLTGGESELLELGGVALAGHPAIARFYFKQSELVSVQVGVTDLRPSRSASNEDAARSIADALSRSFGKGYDCGDRSLGDLTAYECKWLRKPLSIRLWYMDVAGQSPLFYVAYRQSDDPGYNL